MEVRVLLHWCFLHMDLVFKPVPDASPLPKRTLLSQDVPNECDDSREGPKKMNIADLVNVPDESSGHYTISATVIGLIPRNHIVVMKNTPTIVNFRIVVTDGSPTPLELEFNSTQDSGRFLIDIDDVDGLFKNMILIKSPLTFNIERRYVRLPLGVVFHYWTSITPLKELLAQGGQS